MLTQGPALDPKCRFNISSFLTLPHLSDCLICTRNHMPIVLLLQMMEGWDMWGVVDFLSGCGWGDRGWILSYSFCCFYFFHFCFCPLFSHVLCPFF